MKEQFELKIQSNEAKIYHKIKSDIEAMEECLERLREDGHGYGYDEFDKIADEISEKKKQMVVECLGIKKEEWQKNLKLLAGWRLVREFYDPVEYSAILTTLGAKLQNLRDKNILELGYGETPVLQEMTLRGANTYGIDIDGVPECGQTKRVEGDARELRRENIPMGDRGEWIEEGKRFVISYKGPKTGEEHKTELIIGNVDQLYEEYSSFEGKIDAIFSYAFLELGAYLPADQKTGEKKLRKLFADSKKILRESGLIIHEACANGALAYDEGSLKDIVEENGFEIIFFW